MSANCWVTCPKCKKNSDALYRDSHDAIFDELYTLYGKVPATVYETRRQQAVDAFNNRCQTVIDLKATRREDGEFGVDADGQFYVEFSTSCNHCGWSFEFKHKEQVPL